MTGSSLGLILVGAGSSRRMGGIDKVWAPLAGRPIAWHSLNTLYPLADACVLVVRSDCLSLAESLRREHPRLAVVAGGATRRESVSIGLAALQDVEFVAVHDVARPLVPGSLLTAGVEMARACGAAVPTLRLADTVKQIEPDGTIAVTVDREHLRAAQTPQVFRADHLRLAHAQAAARNHANTDDASLFEVDGGTQVQVFDGSARNFKITTEFDLLVARLLLEAGL